MKKVLLDTNAYSDYLRGNEAVLNVLAGAAVVYMSVFVLGELYAGFKGGRHETRNTEILMKFLQKPTVSVLDATIETSEIFASIKNTLKREGNPIPLNDIWISAHVFETGSVLITGDDHFNRIPGLRLLNHSAASRH